MTDDLEQKPTIESEFALEQPAGGEPAIDGSGADLEMAGGGAELAAFSYPGEKTVDRVRDGIDLDDVKDAGEWVWDKVAGKREKAPEPIPIVIDIPLPEEETTMRSSSTAHEDPPPPPPGETSSSHETEHRDY